MTESLIDHAQLFTQAVKRIGISFPSRVTSSWFDVG